jgi:hypothetical protein
VFSSVSIAQNQSKSGTELRVAYSKPLADQTPLSNPTVTTVKMETRAMDDSANAELISDYFFQAEICFCYVVTAVKKERKCLCMCLVACPGRIVFLTGLFGNGSAAW